MQWQRGDYSLTDDRDRVDIDAVHTLLRGTYWAAGRTREQVAGAVANSLCLSLFVRDAQIGFARAVTDYVTFSWLCDVVVAEAYRGRGLGKWMAQILVGHEALAGTRRVLVTKDAQGLYRQMGFQTHPFECMIKWES